MEGTIILPRCLPSKHIVCPNTFSVPLLLEEPTKCTKICPTKIWLLDKSNNQLSIVGNFQGVCVKISWLDENEFLCITMPECDVDEPLVVSLKKKKIPAWCAIIVLVVYILLLLGVSAASLRTCFYSFHIMLSLFHRYQLVDTSYSLTWHVWFSSFFTFFETDGTNLQVSV